MPARDWREIMWSCERWLGQRAPQTAAAILRAAADALADDARPDRLRIHCDRRGLDTVAYHPTCHLEIHEHGGYAHLHGLKAELVGQRDRPLTREDLEGVRARIGALLTRDCVALPAASSPAPRT